MIMFMCMGLDIFLGLSFICIYKNYLKFIKN